MSLHVAPIYAAGVGLVVLAQEAFTLDSPLAVIALALVAPILPVVVGYLLTSRKLKAQDKKVEQVHILVNSRLTETLDALKDALLENIRLKDKAGIEVTTEERKAANAPRTEVVVSGL